jgi:hypothetical protein
MAMICRACGGVIADIYPSGVERHDCKNHQQPGVGGTQVFTGVPDGRGGRW